DLPRIVDSEALAQRSSECAEVVNDSAGARGAIVPNGVGFCAVEAGARHLPESIHALGGTGTARAQPPEPARRAPSTRRPVISEAGGLIGKNDLSTGVDSDVVG